MTKEVFEREVAAAWAELMTLVGSLSDEQLSTPTDAAGWRVQDHIAHLAAWELTKIAVLRGLPRDSALGVPIGNDDFFTVNEDLRQRHAHLTAAQVSAFSQQTHQELLGLLAALPEATLLAPIDEAFPNNGMTLSRPVPVWQVLAGDTFEHYREHIPWIAAIVRLR